MTGNNDFEKEITTLKDEVETLLGPEDKDTIETVAQRLEKLNYAPPILLLPALFFRLNRKSLLIEIDKVLALPENDVCELIPDKPGKCEDLRVQIISAIIFYYKKLILLREDDIDTWDEMDELYVHD